jgi:hypothetical protein
VQDHCVAVNLLAHGEVFQQLGHGADPVGRRFVQHVEGRFGVDHKGRDGAVQAGSLQEMSEARIREWLLPCGSCTTEWVAATNSENIVV